MRKYHAQTTQEPSPPASTQLQATPTRRQVRLCLAFNASALDILQLVKSQNQCTERTLEDEFEAYLLDSQPFTSSIQYWQASDSNLTVITTNLILPLQESQLRFPTLFSGILDIFPIQGSAVPCERVFSSAKETTTARRNRINANLMEALQMLKFSLKQDRGLDFTLGTSKDAEILDLEQSLSDQATVPEDINGFIRRLQEESSL